MLIICFLGVLFVIKTLIIYIIKKYFVLSPPYKLPKQITNKGVCTHSCVSMLSLVTPVSTLLLKRMSTKCVMNVCRHLGKG